MANIVSIDPRNALAYTQEGGPNSSFGPEQTTFGRGFSGRTILNGDRFQDLDRRSAYYECRQHDAKPFDFDGRVASGPRSSQPLMGAEKAHWYVPLKMRRPSAPYRIGKIIVDAFTSLLFGDNRFPAVRVDGDEKSEDFAQTLARVGRLPQKMILARNMGGACGTVGLSWCFYKGKPRFEVHDAKNLHVHAWEDRVALIPRHVSEVYLFYRVQWDGKGFNKRYFWFRRDWTPEWDVVFQDVPYEPKKEPHWAPDLSKSVKHRDGRAHIEWIQNIPTDEEDGLPDYDGLYDQMDALDVLCSVVVRGATLNLDPTLKLKLDPDQVALQGVKKGSDNALLVGLNGDASYLELGGQSIEAGIKLIETKRRSILEAAQCVVPDPHEVAAQGVSSLAAKMMFAPMLAKGDVLREQYGAPIERVLDMMTTVARAASQVSVSVPDPDTGEQRPGQLHVDLPQKVEKKPAIDPDTGLRQKDPETGDDMPDQILKTDREPGEGGDMHLRWPPYFPPTSDDQTKTVANMQIATGGKPFLSAETATEIVAGAYGVDAAAERRKLEAQEKSDEADQASMFPAPNAHGGPPGAPPPRPPKPGGFGAPHPPPPSRAEGILGSLPPGGKPEDEEDAEK